jgi:hypothetical protein
VYIETEDAMGPALGVYGRRANAKGRWAAGITLGPAADRKLSYFLVDAKERKARHGCYQVLGSPSHGMNLCARRGHRSASVSASRRDGDTLRFTLGLYRYGPNTPWRIKMTATASGSRKSVTFDDRANQRGRLRSAVDLRGMDNPRVRFAATPMSGPRCRIGLDPPDRL